MRTDIHNWMPLSIMEINIIFSEMPVYWCIAGGWALDLHLGRQTREHSDIDVIIIREEQLIVHKHLKSDWMLYKAEKGKLTLWEEEYLRTTNDIWVSKNMETPWKFQIMIIDTEENSWIYKRNKSIHRPITEIILKTDIGLPYLKPEIQLLHKAGAEQIREKDYNDFQTVLPLLTPQEKSWLKNAIHLQFPHGHDWLKFL